MIINVGVGLDGRLKKGSKVCFQRFSRTSKEVLWIMSGMGIMSLIMLILHLARAIGLLHGSVIRRVSWSTVFVALGAFALARVAALGPMVRAGSAFLGFGHAFRASVYYLHASRELQMFAGINDLAFALVAYTLILAGAIRWFHRERIRTTTPQRGLLS